MRTLLLISVYCCIAQIASAQCTASITTVGNTTFCQGGSVTLVGSLGDTHQWLLNGTPISGATNDTLVVTAAGSYEVVIDSVGCVDTSIAVQVTVNTVPAQPGPISGPDSVCAGSICTFSFTPVPGATHYRWTTNGFVTWEGFNGDSTSLPTQTGPVGSSALPSSPATTLTVVAFNGTCGPSMPSDKIVNTYSQIIPNGHDPTPDISNLGLPFCPGDSTWLTPFPHGPVGYVGPTSYQWFLDGVAVPGATDLDLKIYRGGQYSLQISNLVCPAVYYPKPVRQDLPNSATISPAGPLVMCQSNPQPLAVNFDMAGVNGTFSWVWTIGYYGLIGTQNDWSILPGII